MTKQAICNLRAFSLLGFLLGVFCTMSTLIVECQQGLVTGELLAFADSGDAVAASHKEQATAVLTLKSFQQPTLRQSIAKPEHKLTVTRDTKLVGRATGIVDAQPVPYIQDSVRLEQGQVTYRLSRHTLANLNRDTLEARAESRLMVAAMSRNTARETRDTIRNTWAFNRSQHVWYVVAGNWSEIEEEFYQYNDLLWLDDVEDYRGITAKAQVLLAAIHKHVRNYEYILKTDDDSYVRMNNLLDSIEPGQKHHQVDYFGHCSYDNPIIRDPKHRWFLPETLLEGRSMYPAHGLGAGYVLRKNLVNCVVQNFDKVKVLPIEDAYIGAIVETCGGNCTDDAPNFLPYDWNRWTDSYRNASWILLHEIHEHKDLQKVHEDTCCYFVHRGTRSCVNSQCSW